MDLIVPTSLGDSRLMVDEAPDARAVLWLGHGAGGGIEAPDLAAMASALPRLGITVVRYEQPWRVAGRTLAPRPATLDVAWLETAPRVVELAAGLPIVVGGRSAGARVACRTATAVRAAGVVCLAFPLHPPGGLASAGHSGNQGKSRLAELLQPEVPVLVVQGDRDPFGSATAVTLDLAGRGRFEVVGVPGSDHGMKVPKSSPLDAAGVASLVVGAVACFVAGLSPVH